jgi:hypothetical protein
MELQGNIGNTAIQEVLTEHPEIGTILQQYDIGCVTCRVGICLLKDVVSIHGLSKENEEAIEEEINQVLSRKNAVAA